MTLPYLGGKSIRANSGLGAWIVGMLPPPASIQTYIEPFAGMLGVLLQRAPAGTEIASDADGRIMLFWRELRDNSIEFASRVGRTLWHRGEFERAVRTLNDHHDADGLKDRDVALAVAIVLAQSMTHTLGSRVTDWRSAWQPSQASARMSTFPPHLQAAAHRVRRVQFETRDAITLLHRAAKIECAVVYCDPPYRSIDVSHRYGSRDLDIEGLTEALAQQCGKVAVSGYAHEWDHLGWVRNEFSKTVIVPSRQGYDGTSPVRTEVLWTNYEPEPRLIQPEMFGH